MAKTFTERSAEELYRQLLQAKDLTVDVAHKRGSQSALRFQGTIEDVAYATGSLANADTYLTEVLVRIRPRGEEAQPVMIALSTRKNQKLDITPEVIAILEVIGPIQETWTLLIHRE